VWKSNSLKRIGAHPNFTTLEPSSIPRRASHDALGRPSAAQAPRKPRHRGRDFALAIRGKVVKYSWPFNLLLAITDTARAILRAMDSDKR
jgi:hypothetical protein